MTLNCLIVDDEPLALDLLESYVSRTPFLHLVAQCDSAVKALSVIEEKPIDLVFLDILENAWNVDGNQSEGWQGCFKGVQYRLPANQGIDVKILYSTAQGLN